MEHFATYITENDVKYIKELGMDHVRLGFDQIVLEGSPYTYRKEIIHIKNFGKEDYNNESLYYSTTLFN